MASTKSSGNKSGSATTGNKQSDQGGSRGGTHEQHVEAGRQSHKNDGGSKSSGGKQSAGGSKNR